MNFNQNTNINNDNCFSAYQNSNNDKMFNYYFLPSVADNKNNSRNSYINSTQNIGFLQNSNYDIKGESIDTATDLRNGTNFKDKSRKELDTRLFPGAPYMSSGQSVLKNTDLSSRLKYGEDTRVSKSGNYVSAYSADNFIPLVPNLANNVQNTDHIIPTFWVRGGMSTRSVLRNVDYLKSCGFKK
jgi:hypothetical protein